MKKITLIIILLSASFSLFNTAWASNIHAKLHGFIDEHHIPAVRSALKKAKPEDTVVISINSLGGVMEVGDVIRDEIKKSQGTVVADIKGAACSEAAFIAIACDDIKGKGKVIFHIGVSVDDNGGSSVPAHLKKKSLSSVEELLTSDEYKRMARGQDILMSVDTLRRRTCKAWEVGCV